MLLPPPHHTDVYTISLDYSLLPSDVHVSADASSVKFLSYINNLHPSLNHDTYKLLETLLAGFIPLFEHTLTDLHRNNPLMQRIPGRCRYTVWDEPEPPEHSDDEEGWVNYEREMRQWSLNRPIDLPDVPESGYPGGLEYRRHVVNLHDRSIQVFVSASEITLVSFPALSLAFISPENMYVAPRGSRLLRLSVACGRHENGAHCCLWLSLPVISKLPS